MAITDYSAIIIPSNAKDRTIIFECLEQIANSKVRQAAEKTLQSEINKRLKDDYKLPPAIIATWVKDLQDPEKRREDEQKQELIETGRAMLIDNAANNKKVATEVKVANFDKSQLLTPEENETPKLVETVAHEEDALDEPEEDALDEPEEVIESKEEQLEFSTEEFEELTNQPETEIEQGTDDFDQLLDELEDSAEPEVIKEVVKDTSTIYESAADLGNEPTNEDFEAVNKNAELAAVEMQDDDDDDFFGIESDDKIESPVTEDTIADSDDPFDGLDDLDFTETVKSDDETLEDISDEEVDDIFANL